MIFEYIGLIFGILKILIYKVIYISRIKLKAIPKMNYNFKLAIKKKSKLIIGMNFRTRNNVSFRVYDGGTLNIGDNDFFNDNCSINCQKNIEIGNNVIFGQNVMLFDHDHDYRNDINKYVRDDVKIGNNVWIGANCIILKGVTIGNNVVIGAGTIVKENIDDSVIVYQKRETTVKSVKRKRD